VNAVPAAERIGGPLQVRGQRLSTRRRDVLALIVIGDCLALRQVDAAADDILDHCP